MNIHSILHSDENVELVVQPKKGLMLHGTDVFKISVGILFIAAGLLIGFTTGHIFFIFFGVAVLCFIANTIRVRLNNTNNTTYVITNKRVIFLNNNGKDYTSKAFLNLTETTFENSGNNTGYIILGEAENVFAGRGITFSAEEYVLDNLNNYEAVSTLIKKLIVHSNSTTN